MAKTAHEKMFSVMGNTNLKQIKIPLCFYQIKKKTLEVQQYQGIARV